MMKPFFIHNVTATELDRYGNVLNIQKGHNAMTKGNDPGGANNNGLVWILDKIFDHSNFYDTSYAIDKMMLGDGIGSADDAGLEAPITAAPTTTLIAFSSGYPLFDVSAPTAPIMKLSCSWGSAFEAFTSITEAGLFVDDGLDTMIAYENFTTPLSKTSLGTLRIDWDITIS